MLKLKNVKFGFFQTVELPLSKFNPSEEIHFNFRIIEWAVQKLDSGGGAVPFGSPP